MFITILFSIILTVSVSDTLAALHKILPSDGSGGDCFGVAVDIADGFGIIGAQANDHKGSAYIFEANPSSNNWAETQKLQPADLEPSDFFGSAVSIIGIADDGGYAIVGAQYEDSNGITDNGAAYIFERASSGQWSQTAKLTASNPQHCTYFARSVGISSAGYAIVGATHHDNGVNTDEGLVYIFVRNEDDGVWAEQTILTAPEGSGRMYFGYSVSMSGTYAIVGATYHDSNGKTDNGAAFIYEFASEWTLKATLYAPDAENSDNFGRAVDISSGFAIIGSPYNDDTASNSGSAYIFETDENKDWQFKVKLTAADPESDDYFGWSVAINSRGYCIVGAYREDSAGSDAGAVYIFHRDSTNGEWSQTQKIMADDAAASDYFGESVGISEANVIITGARNNDDNGGNSGSAYIGLSEECATLDCKNTCLLDECDALSGCSDVIGCLDGEVCMDPFIECTRDCQLFDVDPFLTDCSSEFSINTNNIAQLQLDVVAINGELDGHDADILDINSKFAIIEDSIQDVIDQHNDDKTARDSAITAINGHLTDIDDEIDGHDNSITTINTAINAAIAAVNHRIDLLQPIGSEASSISIPSASLFSSYKDELIILLLIVNILMMITCFVVFYKIKSNKYDQITMYSSDDEENKQLKN